MKHIKTLLIIVLSLAVLLSSVPAAFAAYEHGDVAAVYVYDHTFNEVLYAYNEDSPLPPASTTKMLTALLVFEAIDSGSISFDDEVTVTEETISTLPYDASRMDIPLEPDEVMTVHDLLCAHLISSDCLASNVLGNYVCGNIEDFVTLMNARASELGCENTNFTNPSGYPDENMYTTAHSLYLIAAECMTHELFREIVSTDVITLQETNMNSQRVIRNSNKLLHESNGENPYYYEYAIGIKTGYSSSSGYCLVSASSYNGHDIYVVVLGGELLLDVGENVAISDDSDATYVYTQYTETLSAYNYFYDLFAKQELLQNTYDENLAIMQDSFASASFTHNQVLNDDESIISAFTVRQQQAAESRKNIMCLAVACLFIFILIVLTIQIIKHRKHTKDAITK